MTHVPIGPAALHWRPDLATAHPTPRADETNVLARVNHAVAADVFACPLPWLGGDFNRETWLLDHRLQAGHAHGWDYVAGDGLAFAALHIDDGEDAPAAIQQAAFDAYTCLFALQRSLGLGHVQRIWHWLSAVTAGSGDDERYQRFCRGRAEALDMPDHGMPTLPPATLVAGHRRGVRLHALLGDRPVEAVENPRQVSAYAYPRDYGLRAPAFARAGRVQLAGTPYLLVSGTASIVGHESRHRGNVAAQAEEALDNIAAVMGQAGTWSRTAGLAGLECLKAYVREPDDAATIEAIARRRAPGVALALLHAPLCRAELLVEFEAQQRLI